MENKKLGRNRGIWSGVVVSELTFDHSVKDRVSGEVIESFLVMEVEVTITNKQGDLIDTSVLPCMVAQSAVDKLTRRPRLGDVVFMKGPWRAYDVREADTGRTQLEQNALVKVLEVHDTYPVRTRNKFEFKGVLVKKLYKFMRDAEGVPLKDETGKLLPKLDVEGNMEYTVRRNKEGKRVNDFIVAINRTNGSDYVPCIAYSKMAGVVAEDIPIGSEVEGVGYIRARRFEDRHGNKQVAYETVVTALEVVPLG